ncbi:hypothetical protein EJB05_21924, partial [Eragrostis curvula]
MSLASVIQVSLRLILASLKLPVNCTSCPPIAEGLKLPIKPALMHSKRSIEVLSRKEYDGKQLTREANISNFPSIWQNGVYDIIVEMRKV